MKVAILDKHVLFAESLQQLLIRKSDIVDPYIYQSVESLIEHAYDKSFDMMIVDRSFLGADENALINYLRSRYPAEMSIVILVETDESDSSISISLSKVNAVIKKNTPIDEFIERIIESKDSNSFVMVKSDW